MLIEGLNFDPRQVTRIRKYLKKMPKAVAASARKAIAAEARTTIMKAQEVVPVVTGLLKRSSYIKRSAGGVTKVQIQFGFKVKEANRARSGKTRVIDYAPHVEYGTINFEGRFYMRYAKNFTKAGRPKRIAQFIRKDLKNLRA